MSDALIGLRRSMEDLVETAYSPDGLVRATVGARGLLTELFLDPRIYRTTDAAALAETITATIQAATDAATARMVELTRPFLPDGPISADADPDTDDGLGLAFDPLLQQLDRQLDRDKYR